MNETEIVVFHPQGDDAANEAAEVCAPVRVVRPEEAVRGRGFGEEEAAMVVPDLGKPLFDQVAGQSLHELPPLRADNSRQI